MFNLSTLRAKIIIAAIVLSVLGGFGFYVKKLNDKKDTLQIEKVELTNKVKIANELIKETNRREEVVADVSTAMDVKREANERSYQKKVVHIDKVVQEGKDKPVGPLLNEFFNSGL